jgi:ABC-type polysaccharide transport system permease subunit
MVSNYLFGLVMGLVGIILTYLDSLQSKKKVSKINYIKVFMAASIISIITSEFFRAGIKVVTTSPVTVGGSLLSTSTVGQSRQEILTGNPDF